MAKQIILISGSVGVGKSTLSDALNARFGIEVLKTNKLLRDLSEKRHANEAALERKSMQAFGEKMDKETKGRWVLNGLKGLVTRSNPDAVIVVDAVRIPEQIREIRVAYGFLVKHVHLHAPDEVLEQRYADRHPGKIKELSSYQDVKKNKTEKDVKKLFESADIVIDTSLCGPDDVLVRAASHLGLYTRDYERLVDVIVGGQWGSEGKGHIASYLSPEYSTLVRVGGPNAGHKVFLTPEPYVHHQLPSGTLRSPAKLVIAPGSVLNAENLLKEIAECKVDTERLSIDPQAMLISKADITGEGGLVKGIGSTGQGVGYATSRRIRDRNKGVKLAKDHKELKPYIRPTWELLEAAYARGEKILLEGTQGAGLSLYHGTYPWVTSRDTSVAGCLSEAGISPTRVRKVVLVCRSYPIRVQNPNKGTSGPMGIEIDWETVAKRSKVPIEQLQGTEKTSTTHRKRRVAEFSWTLLRRASALNGPTDIAISFADYIERNNENARRFDQLSAKTISFVEEVERVAAAPVSLISVRFDFRSIIDRRAW